MQTRYMVDWYRELAVRFDGDPDAFPVPAFSEDCLYLNIWTPSLDPAARLPVMVWIHGGNHRGGWSSEPDYDGEALAGQDAVVVSLAYRVDLFGFFAHPELATADFGLLDQAAALAWVRRHIGAFGGDAANITVFGESAGAASIGYLLASPQASPLFDKVIHQSAGYEATTFDERDDFLAQGRALERAVLDGTGGIDALREVPAEQLLAAAETVYAAGRPGVMVDGVVVTAPFAKSLAAGALAAKPLLIGSNRDEWLMYLDTPVTAADVEAELAALDAAPRAAVAAALSAGDSPARRLDRLITAREFVCPSLALAAYTEAAGQPAYVYYFDRVREGSAAAAIGAYHGAEIPYVFGNHAEILPTATSDRRLSQDMMQYWTSFARTGKPLPLPAAPAWPAYTASSGATMRLGDELRVEPHPERQLCAAFAATPDGQLRQ